MKNIGNPTDRIKSLRPFTHLLQPVLFILVFVLWGSQQVKAQVTIDAVNSAYSKDAVTTITISHTTGNVLNRIMLVGVSTRGRTVTSVTYGTDQLESVGSEGSNTDAVTYIFMLVNPSIGTDDVVVTFNSNLGKDNAGVVGVMTFSGVDQNTPLGTYTSSPRNDNAPTLTINSTTTSQIVYNVLAVTDDVYMPITLNSSQTSRWEYGGTTLDLRPTGGGYTGSGISGTTTFSYSLIQTDGSGDQSRRWSLSGVAINAVPIADLSIAKTVDHPEPYAGQTITFTLTATNNGSDNALNVQVSDLLPSGYTYQSHSTVTGTYNGGSGVWDIGTLNADVSATLTISAVVNKTGDYANTATITGDVIDNTSGNNSSSVTITVCQAGGTAPLFSQP